MTAKKNPRRSTSGAKQPSAKSSPQEIAPGVFLGGWNDAAGFEGIRFCVLDEAPSDMPAEAHISVYDGARDGPDMDHLERLAREVQAARDRGGKVLIFCGHGVRRGPLGAAWYLHRHENLSIDEAYERIRAVRPKVEHAREWIGHPEPLDA
jgi:hypothetical protein